MLVMQLSKGPSRLFYGEGRLSSVFCIQIHRVLMVLAVLCTVAAIIVIYIELDGEYTEVGAIGIMQGRHPTLKQSCTG